jgi:hypothetical protein
MQVHALEEASGKTLDCGLEMAVVVVQTNAEQIKQVEKNRGAADDPERQENQPNDGALRFTRHFAFHVSTTMSSIALPASSRRAGE